MAMEMEQNSLISELNNGKELAIQLITHLQPSSSSQETCVFLTQQIHFSFQKALSILNLGAFMEDLKPQNAPELPSCLSPHSQDSNDKKKQQKDVFKKRKLLPRWKEEVKVCSGTGLEGPLNDGYSWRKYGQKDIHGATFPRCYYRCSNRNVQGCLATKQVQRSDSDPNIFQVTYRGRHTCSQSSSLPPKQTKQILHKPALNKTEKIWFDFGQDFNLKTEDFDDVFSSFCSSIASETVDENNVFYDSVMETAFNGGGGLNRVQSSGQLSDLTDPTSVTNSPILSWDYKLDFDPNFPSDNLDFFS